MAITPPIIIIMGKTALMPEVLRSYRADGKEAIPAPGMEEAKPDPALARKMEKR
jgi:hypothetical protein